MSNVIEDKKMMWLLLIRRAACEGLGRASQPHGSFCPSFYFWKNNALTQIETQNRKKNKFEINYFFLSRKQNLLLSGFSSLSSAHAKAAGNWHHPGMQLWWIIPTERPGGRGSPLEVTGAAVLKDCLGNTQRCKGDISPLLCTSAKPSPPFEGDWYKRKERRLDFPWLSCFSRTAEGKAVANLAHTPWEPEER